MNTQREKKIQNGVKPAVTRPADADLDGTAQIRLAELFQMKEFMLLAERADFQDTPIEGVSRESLGGSCGGGNCGGGSCGGGGGSCRF